MKELFNILSSVSNFFNEKRFVFGAEQNNNEPPKIEGQKIEGRKTEEKKAPEAIAKDMTEKAKKSAKKYVDEGELTKLMEKATKEGGDADPKDEIDTLLANDKARRTDEKREALQAKVQKIIDKRFGGISPDRFAQNMKKPSKKEDAKLAVENFAKAMKGLKVDLGKATTDEEMDSALSIDKRASDKNTGLARNTGTSESDNKI